ncbi:hypothetical protein CBR_g37381 [Chara braunii]|uniref:Uncharacterized protein n=1 Tax=Chara braunii TaxID=69332 RepID=A0A388JZV0_CHABU|nr:hypothetical protein CBR_g37381 [Chara braunii]|eukprot:GBG63295.1 hypothetical protein CBR_g37381 [Chara braunii]
MDGFQCRHLRRHLLPRHLRIELWPTELPEDSSTNPFPAPGNRAWFTREHLELIKRWKAKDQEEAKKTSEDSSGSSKQGAKKGHDKSACKSEDEEQNLKAWMAENFGSSLRKISKKLDVVDKKAKIADMEREKLVKKVEEIEGKSVNEESNSNEKRKRIVGVNSPSIERSRSKSRSRSGGIKIRQPRIEVSSDDEETKKAGKGATRCSNPSEVKLEDVMKMLSVIANRGQGENPVVNTNTPATDRGKRTTVENKSEGTTSDESEDERDKLKVNRGCKKKDDKTESGIVEYMRQRLDHYMEMNGKKIKSLCAKRNIKWVRKDKCAWELANKT